MDEIKDIQSFLNFEHDFINKGDEVWYRGQCTFEWDLIPSFFRLKEDSITTETSLLDIFIQNSSTLLTTPSNPIDWIFIMQHYGIPTRLLDWTENPLVALYFAVEDYRNQIDGSLWLLKPKVLNNKAINIPTIPMYNDKSVSEHMENKDAVYAKKPAAILATRNNSRLQIQDGVFTIHMRNGKDIHDDSSDYLLKIKIPASSKEKIYNQLKLLGINKFRLFPELSNIKDIIEQKKFLEKRV
ncbi:FRG domain-containing protein [Aliarcobacter skirrowii]|uniref:FRG domain-containing protein n=1 Tax=Aliarcobacter skirrowii TaxID=28200 RepID=UPI0029B62A84|nr:FRG domain-containing protein [Aliarcobacter skirrowii]MDX4066616.1 FRG domain-containing protein [Aliarcobacter skirrowii]